VPIFRASDLSGLSCRLFWKYTWQEQTVLQLCSHGEMELHTIGVLVVLNVPVCDDVTHQTAVYGEQQRLEHEPAWNADFELYDC